VLRQLHERLKSEADAENVVTLRTNVSVPRAEGSRSYVQRQHWFTIVNPDAELTARARAFANVFNSVPRVRARLA
jgi:hypothetical protein